VIDPAEPAALMRGMTAMRTFGDWVADGAVPPAPAHVGTVFPLSEARPAEWPEWAPWVPMARHAANTEMREVVFGQGRDARGASRTVGALVRP